jgi:hypothetical protein
MDVEQQGARIRAQIRGLGTHGRGRRYPVELRGRVIAYVAARRAQSVTLRGASREVELPWRTVEHWLHDRKPAAPATTPAFRPVAVTPVVVAPRMVVVHGPRGLRIEGLSVVEIAELCTRLG